MEETFDPLSWLSKWTGDPASLAKTWTSVHERFGFAAQVGCELETAVVMLVSRSQQIKEQRLSFKDLLEYLEINGGLTLGRLVVLLSRIYSVPTDLQKTLMLGVKRRNFLIHHFYRHRAALFQSPEGCERLKDELVCIQDDLSAAVDQLKSWKDTTFGARPDDEVWDEIRQDVQKWREEHEAMLKAMLGGKDAI